MVPTIPYAPTPAVVPGPEPGTVFRTWSGPVRAWMTLLDLAMAVLLTFLTLVAAGTVVLDASHATWECVITRSYPLLGEHKETHPLAAVQGTTLLRRFSRGRTSFAVALRLAQGDVTLSSQYARTGRDQRKRPIDAFLADPGAPPLHLVYDPGNPMPLLSPWGGDLGRCRDTAARINAALGR